MQTKVNVFNLSGHVVEVQLPDKMKPVQLLHGHGSQQGTLTGSALRLPAYGVFYARLDLASIRDS